MVEMNIVYKGELRCAATHGPSGTTIITDAPVDNHGKGESFSPTDLVAVALGTCMLTTMGISAQKHGFEIGTVQLTVRKEMAAQPSRRIARLPVVITMSVPLNEEQKAAMQRAAMGCPVKVSLHPDIELPIEFVWGG